MRFDIRYRCRFTYDATRARVAERAAGVPGVRRVPAAHLLPRADGAVVAGALVHRLVGHAGRRLRCARAAPRARRRRRGDRRDPRRGRCSPPTRASTRSPIPRFLDRARRVPRAHAARRLGRRRRAEAARRQVGRSPGRASCRRCWRSTGSSARTSPTRPGTTYVGVDVDEVFARRQGRVPGLRPPRGRAVPGRRHPRPLRVGLPVHRRRRHAATTATSDVVAVQTHAWFEAAIPGFGWLALDPTNGLEVGLRHVTIGHGRDYDDVPPLRGVFAGSVPHELEVTVDIRRLSHPAPAVVPARASEAAARLASRNDDAALRRAEEDRHQQQQQQQQ